MLVSLGWLIEPAERSILVFQPDQQPQLLQGSASLSVLEDIHLNLTVDQIFSWLKMSGH